MRKSERRAFRLAVGVTALLGLVVGALSCGWRGRPVESRVAWVYDGDTIKLSDGRRVRFIGIDCPESRMNDKLRRDARRRGVPESVLMQRGQKASYFTREMLLSRKVRLEFDAERRDSYGRLLAYVFLPVCSYRVGERPCSARDPFPGDEFLRLPLPKGREGLYLFVNATIVKSGFAEPMEIPPNTRYAELFARLYDEARARHRGLWAGE